MSKEGLEFLGTGAYGSDICGYVTNQAIDYLDQINRIKRPKKQANSGKIKRDQILYWTTIKMDPNQLWNVLN